MPRGHSIKHTLIAVAFCFALATRATAAPPKAISIPPGPLVPALESLSKQMTLELIYEPKQLKAFRTVGLSGTYTAQDAVHLLLRGTPLKVKEDPSGAMAIVPVGSAEASGDHRSASVPSDGNGKGGKRQSSGSFRMAEMAQGASGSAASLADGPATSSNRESTPAALAEIVVTADKVAEPVMNVPMSMTALTGTQLEQSGSFRFEDYVGQVPGLSLASYGALGGSLVIRGITSGIQPINSSVAVYVDETPNILVGGFAGSGFNTPNLDTFDMERIEVLRGPQGTLYGANALGGILKYVTNAPDPSGFDARGEFGASTVYNGATGYDSHAMLNIPLSATSALRLVGYDTYYPGFIDNITRGTTDVNNEKFNGGRASFLYEPSSLFSIRFSALYQDRSWGGAPTEDVEPTTLTPAVGALNQQFFTSQPGHTSNGTYNATLKWRTAIGNLVSSTSYYDIHPQDVIEDSVLEPTVGRIFGSQYGVAINYAAPAHAVTQEVRLSSKGTTNLQWLAGGFLTNENSLEHEPLLLIDDATGAILYNNPVNVGAFNIHTHYNEYAGFANLDYHVTQKFDAAIGGRWSHNDQTLNETALGVFGGGVAKNGMSSEGVFTYSADARFHITEHKMVYMRVATGYAPGGPNGAAITQRNLIPPSYQSSHTTNYEFGFKGDFLDGRILATADAYLIHWDRIQLVSTVGGFSATVSGGSARSDGVEWSVDYSPVSGLTLSANGAYDKAILTADTPPTVGGLSGDRLPITPLWETSVGTEYRHLLIGYYSAFGSLNWRYTGSRYGEFETTGPRQLIPSFNVVDFQAGVRADRWSLAVYAKNIANSIAINYVQDKTLEGGLGEQSATLYPPRTIGLTAIVNF